MCGRYTLTRVGELQAFFELDEKPEVAARYNIAPTQEALAVRVTGEGRRLAQFMSWGFVSDSSPASSPLLINARSETVNRKRTFRDSFAHRRCLIPSDGFYEWRRQGGLREPIHFRRNDGGLFAFAAIWVPGQSRRGGELPSFAILTTAANDLVAPVHNRMPVLLSRPDFGCWLDPHSRPDALKQLLRPFASKEMECRAVNPIVNSTKVDSPGCLSPPPARARNLDLFS